MTHALSDDLALVGDVFINSVLDSVTLGEGNPTSPRVYTNRDGNLSVMGLELELPHSPRQGLMWSLSYGLTRARLGGLFDGEALENSPTHHVTGRAIVPIVPLVLSFVTRVSVDSGRRDLEGAWPPPRCSGTQASRAASRSAGSTIPSSSRTSSICARSTPARASSRTSACRSPAVRSWPSSPSASDLSRRAQRDRAAPARRSIDLLRATLDSSRHAFVDRLVTL